MVIYECKTCKFSTGLKSNYTRHIETSKHKSKVSENADVEASLREECSKLRAENVWLRDQLYTITNQQKQEQGLQELKFPKIKTLADIIDGIVNDMFYVGQSEAYLDKRTDIDICMRQLSGLDMVYIFYIYIKCVSQKSTEPLAHYIRNIMKDNFSIIEGNVFVTVYDRVEEENREVKIGKESRLLRIMGKSLIECYKYYMKRVQQLKVRDDYEEQYGLVFNGYIDFVDDILVKDGKKYFLNLDFFVNSLKKPL